jgi:preprotein translocase subunit YajC
MTLVSIPAILLLYFVAEWTIWQIAIIFALQTVYYFYIFRKQDEKEKKEWDEKWEKGA